MGAAGMTLVFKRAALGCLVDPAAAFADARNWTEYIGLISDDPPERLSSFAARRGIDPDFLSSIGGQTGGLAVARQRFPTERHVFVGTTTEDQQLAQSLGWEYLGVAEAADAADWSLTTGTDGHSADATNG